MDFKFLRSHNFKFLSSLNSRWAYFQWVVLTHGGLYTPTAMWSYITGKCLVYIYCYRPVVVSMQCIYIVTGVWWWGIPNYLGLSSRGRRAMWHAQVQLSTPEWQHRHDERPYLRSGSCTETRPQLPDDVPHQSHQEHVNIRSKEGHDLQHWLWLEVWHSVSYYGCRS